VTLEPEIRPFRAEDAAGVAELVWAAVRPDHRRRGLGARLYRMVFARTLR
jgi:ribosomal protein S18 acetylase RimI-like enzyme